MSTPVAKMNDLKKKWYVIDLENQVLGRVASEIARVLRGKHTPQFTPSVDTGDFVIVINADKVRLTGNKLNDKFYYRHTGYPGGIRSITAGKLLEQKPEMIIQKAVRGMLPKNKLGRQMFRKLKVYTGPDHPHSAQQPREMKI